MESFSIWHWMIILIWFGLVGIPFARIIHKAGYMWTWVLIGVVPVVNLVFLWIFAFSRWPARGDA